MLLLKVTTLFSAICFSFNQISAVELALPKPKLAQQFGQCVKVSGVITEIRDGNTKAFEPYFILAVAPNNITGEDPKPIEIKVAGWSTALSNAIKSASALSKQIEVIGYETFSFVGQPNGMRDFTELESLEWIQDRGWSVNQIFFILHIK